MTNLEAIKRTQKNLDSFEKLLTNGNACWYVGSEQGDSLEKEIDYCKCVIEALEKQVPKKPILRYKNKMYCCECSNCGSLLSGSYKNYFADETFKFCYCCSQAIDWNEVEE